MKVSYFLIYLWHATFWGILQKNGIKTSDFRDLLLEGAIFIVGTQNLPQMIS